MSAILPDMTASNREKDSPSFGVEMARYIVSEWGNSEMAKRRKEIDLMRSHLEGEVDASNLQSLFRNKKDVSALGINWRYQSPVPKFINSITQSISYDKYRTEVTGVDAHSQNLRSQFRREKKKAMLVKSMAEEVSQKMGMDFTPKGFVPETDEELDLYMKMEYKQSQEIAAEIGIQKVLDFNDWREVFSQIVTDLALNSLGVAKVEYDPNTAVKFRYVDIRNFIHSQDIDKTRNGKGCFYFGEYKKMTVGELERLSDTPIPPKVLRSLAGRSEMVDTDSSLTDSERQMIVEVLYFTFKTNRYDMKRKRNYRSGRYKYISQDDYWEPNKRDADYALRIPYEVWYEGIYLPGTETVVNYGLMDHMARDPRNYRKALAPYIMYDLKSTSIGRQIVDIADEIYITRIKLRQLLAKIRPKGYAINKDALGGLTDSEGKAISITDQVRLFNEDGNLLYSGKSLIDDTLNTAQAPIHDLPNDQREQLSELIAVHNNLVQEIHELTGISPQATGAPPPERTSQAVFQGSMNASQKSFNNIFMGMLNIQQHSGEVILARLHSASVLGDTANIVKHILGEFTVNRLKDFSSMHRYQYVINIDLKPTDQDRRELKEVIASAIQTQSLSASDLIDIDEVDNIRLAKQMIKIREKAALKRRERAEAVAHQRGLEQEKAKQMYELEKIKVKAQLDTQGQIQVEMAKAKIQAAGSMAKLKEVSLKGQYDIAVAKIRENAASKTMVEKEDREDERASMRASQESQIAFQKANNTGPQSFSPPNQSTEKITPKQ